MLILQILIILNLLFLNNNFKYKTKLIGNIVAENKILADATVAVPLKYLINK